MKVILAAMEKRFIFSFKWIERHAFNLNWHLISIVYLSIDHKLGGNLSSTIFTTSTIFFYQRPSVQPCKLINC